MTGDFNDNGQDTVGLHRESTGFVYYRDTLTTGIANNSFFFGNPGDRIITGRWVQNPSPGPATVGIFRPSNGTFYLRFSNTQGNANTQFPYGNSNMLPVAGNFGPLPGGGSAPPPNLVTFGPGTWIVGTDIPPGTYRNSGNRAGCYWERLSGFGGTFGEIITNEFTNVRQIVTVAATDAGFAPDSDCGTWSNDLTPSKAPTASFGGGVWQVPSEVAPGLWKNTPADTGCYWERRSGFGGTFSEIITNDFIGDTSSTLVQISASDVGFAPDEDCGTWSYQGP